MLHTQDAISSNTNIGDSHFDEQHVYRTEWVSGPDGYIAWYMDDAFLYSITADALNLTGSDTAARPLPAKPATAWSQTASQHLPSAFLRSTIPSFFLFCFSRSTITFTSLN